MNEPEDPLPGLMAELDQALAMTPQWARYINVRYKALMKEGMTPWQALFFLAVQNRTEGS